MKFYYKRLAEYRRTMDYYRREAAKIREQCKRTCWKRCVDGFGVGFIVGWLVGTLWRS